MKKTISIITILGSVSLFANGALKSEVSAWLATVDGGTPKIKYDGLAKDKQAGLDKFFEDCRADVASGKLPKGTCKPLFLEKLKGL